MLKAIKKLAASKEPEMNQEQQEALAASSEEAVQLANTQAAQLAEQAAAFTAVQASLTELTAKFEATTALLASVTEQRDALLSKAEKERNDLRMSVITAAVGEAKATALFEATTALEDTQFNAVVSALANSVEAEANSPLFNEVGVSAEADLSKVNERQESGEMKILKAKYKKA